MRKEDNREKYKEYDHRYYIKHRRPNSKIGKLETKISDLEAKLAEKEKENERLKELVMHKTYNRNAVEARLNYEQNQLAIEQLEKVKEKALHFYVNDTPKLTGFYIDINEIDNQIKQLTHQHEDKGE